VVPEVMPPLHPDQLVETVGAGEHRWEYPAEIDQRVTYDFDTTLRTLAGDPAVWRRSTDVFSAHFPGIALAGLE
jgi:alpha-L-rhamnosidase